MGAPQLVDHHGAPVAALGGRVGVGGFSHAGYVGASRTHQDLARWLPRRFSGQSALSPDRDLLTRRIHDLARNDGWASAGMDRLVDNIIGGGWRLNAKPNAVALGLDDDAVTELAGEIEAAWDTWANDDADCFCDREMRNGFGGLLALAYRHRAMDGEALATISYEERGGPWGTSVQVVDPDRLMQPMGVVETPSFRQGIELGPNNEPLAYHIRVRHPGDPFYQDALASVRVPRFVDGRRVVVHAFETGRAGQVRGAPGLSTVVKKLRMLGRYDEAELQAAVMNAVLAAFVTSPYDHAAVAEALSAGPGPSADENLFEVYLASRQAYWKDAPPIDLDGVAVNFLHPGEDVKMTNATHPNAVFEPFVRASLRNVAAALGLTYEQLTADWSQVNYSSARAALIEVWRGFTARAGHFALQFVIPIYVRWFEEAVARKRVRLPAKAPSFQDAKVAWTRARWLMPGRGWVDPMKEAQASGERLRLGISTMEREAAEQGQDWEEVLQQRAREHKRIRELEAQYGLDAGTLVWQGPTNGTDNPLSEERNA